MAVEEHRNRELFDRALAALPGGVSSPVRAFRAVGGTPLFIAHAEGCRFADVEGDEYTDFVLSWGPLILGHGLQNECPPMTMLTTPAPSSRSVLPFRGTGAAGFALSPTVTTALTAEEART